MRQHLTQEEIMRYMDTSDLSEEYMLWLEEAQAHVDDCALCQAQLRRFMVVEQVCETDMLSQGIDWLGKEEDVRKNIVLLQLGMLEQNERIQRVRQSMIRGEFLEYVIKQSQIGRKQRILRGNRSDTSEPEFSLERIDTGIRIKFDDPAMVGHEIIFGSDNAQSIQLCTVVWSEAIGAAIADAEGTGDLCDYHIYIL